MILCNCRRSALVVAVSSRGLASSTSNTTTHRRDTRRKQTPKSTTPTTNVPAAASGNSAVRALEQEASQIQQYFRHRSGPSDPRDQFGSIAAKQPQRTRMPQPAPVLDTRKLKAPDESWEAGPRLNRVVYERERKGAERWLDEFAAGRGVAQITTPAPGTCPGLRKQARIVARIREKRERLKAEAESGTGTPHPLVLDPGCQ